MLLNEKACDIDGNDCELIYACFASHICVIQQAQTDGLHHVLILEDDVYFDVEKLAAGVRSCRAFLKAGLDFSAFLFGGVYTEMQKTDIDHIFSGKGMQAHAWLVNVQHPVWATASTSGHRMPDVFHHVHGVTYMLHPDIAFQRSFWDGKDSSAEPVYNLAEIPPLYRILTKLGIRFGMRNCWEGCAKNTNALVKRTGSIKVALIVLGSLVGLLSLAIVTMACTWVAWAKKKLSSCSFDSEAVSEKLV